MSANDRRKLKRRLANAKATLADLERRMEDDCALAGYVMFWQGTVTKLERQLSTKPA